MHTFLQYSKKLEDYKRIVFKIGSGVLESYDGKLSIDKLNSLSDQLAELNRVDGKEIILVSSGAILTGKGLIKEVKVSPLSIGDPEIIQNQVYAANGQIELMAKYQSAFRKHNIKAGQILLSKDDFENDKRRINTYNTIETILYNNGIPAINENDTTTTEEIKLGDNDNLSALVAELMNAQAVIKITSDMPGIVNKSNKPISQNGRTYNPGELIEAIYDINKLLEDGVIKLDEKSKAGTGGAMTTIDAAEKLMYLGIPYFVIQGGYDKHKTIQRLFSLENIGTVFMPKNQK